MLVANKVCRFGGRPYVKGEPVPDRYIDPRGVKRLLDADILREVPDEKQVSPPKDEPAAGNESEQEETAQTAEIPTDGDLKALDRNRLYRIAKDKGLDVKPTMSKAKLLEALA